MGALTINVRERGVAGNQKWAAVDAQFSTSYATGGDTGMTRAALGFDSILFVQCDQPAGYQINYDFTNGTLLARYSSHLLRFQTVAAANAVTAAADSLRTPAAAFTVAGRATNTGEGGIVDSAGAQVAATTDLSTTAVSTGLVDENGAARNAIRCMVWGK